MKKEIDRTKNSKDPRWDQLLNYVGVVATKLGLGNYICHLKFATPDKITEAEEGFLDFACIDVNKYMLTYDVYFSDDFFRAKSERQRQAVVHELLHVLEHPIKEVIYGWAYVLSDEDRANYKLTSERFIDTLANLLEEQFEVPVLTKEEEIKK